MFAFFGPFSSECEYYLLFCWLAVSRAFYNSDTKPELFSTELVSLPQININRYV